VRGFGTEEAPVYSDSFDVYTGNANPGLARKICRYLGVPLGRAEVFSFSNENIFVKILDNVREKDVFVVQPTCHPVNQSIMELLILIDAFKRASAGRITAVVPYYAYGRSDKKDQPRVPITARLVADMITVGWSRTSASPSAPGRSPSCSTPPWRSSRSGASGTSTGPRS